MNIISDNYRQGRNSPEDDVIIRRPNGIHSAQNWHTRDRPPSGRFSKASNNTYPSRNDEVIQMFSINGRN